MMKEIGGYLELDNYMLPMLHNDAIALNSGRNCLVYLIKKKKIKKIYVPKFLCASIAEVCSRERVEVKYYSINEFFLPKEIKCTENEWVYIVNFYGQLSNEVLINLKNKYKNIIIDNVQAYFQENIQGIDTIYTCRKFFGVPDGAFLYSDVGDDSGLEYDESYEKMKFILGRYERVGSEFYEEYIEREMDFETEPVKHMSKLTANLLHGIDYDFIKEKRSNNYWVLHSKLGEFNHLNLSIIEGAYMYPLYIENGNKVRKYLQQNKIYISTLWPDVFELCSNTELEYKFAENILPIPVDQRYTEEDMCYIVDKIMEIKNIFR